MEIEKGVDKKPNSIMKKLERYLSLADKESKPSTKTPKKMLTKSKSMQSMSSTSRGGCFSVYVGPEKQRFVIKAKVANHPLFRMLLEDAELEYGFDSGGGPLLIPCEVEMFYKVMAEMDGVDQVDPRGSGSSHGPSSSHFIARTRSSYEDDLLAQIQIQKQE